MEVTVTLKTSCLVQTTKGDDLAPILQVIPPFIVDFSIVQHIFKTQHILQRENQQLLSNSIKRQEGIDMEEKLHRAAWITYEQEGTETFTPICY